LDAGSSARVHAPARPSRLLVTPNKEAYAKGVAHLGAHQSVGLDRDPATDRLTHPVLAGHVIAQAWWRVEERAALLDGGAMTVGATKRRHGPPLPTRAGCRMLLAIGSGVLLCFSSVARGAENEATATRTAQPPVIDGVIAQSEWDSATRLEDFIQLEPRSGEPASGRTVSFFLYGDTHVYVAVRAYDSWPGAITARLNNRDDDLIQDDSVSVFLDTFHD